MIGDGDVQLFFNIGRTFFANLQVKKRREIVAEFGRKFVSHDITILNDEDFREMKLNKNSKNAREIFRYSLFITGSNQVWRMIDKEACFLTFVPEGKKNFDVPISMLCTCLTFVVYRKER